MKKEKFGASAFISLLILVVAVIDFAFGDTALAATTMPVFEPLPSIDAQVDSPTAVTVDSRGRLYVAEPEDNQVRVFTQGGQYLATLAGLNTPISVAVDGTGRIYVGSASMGSVTVFAADFTEQFKLGSGDREFGEPVDIDIDSSGQIYVVDKGNNTVQVYTATTGVLLKSIGTVGNSNGQFYHPTSLAIDPVSLELVIIDRQQVLDQFSGAWIDGARIQFFGMDGTFRRGYSKFGSNMNAGQLFKPTHVAVDPKSRVYITDSRWQKVMVYGKDGLFLGMIDNSNNPLLTPLGLCISTAGRLYVASLRRGKVDIFGIDAYLAMDLAPDTLNFTVIEGGNAPDPQNVTIKNSGKQELTWAAATTTAWLNLASAAGTLQPTATSALAVGVKNAGLTQGTYKGSIAVSTLDMAEKVAVILTVTNPLVVSPASLSFTTTTGTTSTLALSVTNAGTEPLNWSATADQSWLKLSKSEGELSSIPDDRVEITADASALEPGTYDATVTFINSSSGSSVLVPVTLTVNPNPLLVSPASLSFTTTTGTMSTLVLSVANAGTVPLNWSAAADQSWLKLSNNAGKTGSTPDDKVEITADASALAPGTYPATITFINGSSAGGNVLVPVTLTVNPNPLLVSPGNLSFTTTRGARLSPLALSVTNAGTESLHWGATASEGWLKLSKSEGDTPDKVTIVADISDLSTGPYSATITFSNKSTGGSILVPVSLIVSEPNPLLVSPASVSFTTKKGSSPSSRVLSVTNAAGGDPLEWNADVDADQSWLKLSKNKGKTGSTPDDKVEINVDASALAPGTYTTTITFISTSGSVLVPVKLKVGMFPWLLIIQNMAIIGEQQLDKEDKDQSSKGQQPAKISGPENRQPAGLNTPWSKIRDWRYDSK
jgi:uncharacterized membrane protein